MRVAPYRGGRAAWDSFVETAPGGTFCHLSGWVDALAEGLRHDLSLVCAEREGTLEGAMALARVRGPLGSFLVSVPFLNYGGPAGTPEAARALIDHAVERGRAAGVDLVELRCRSRVWNPAAGGGGAPLEGLPAGVRESDRRVAVVLDLPANADDLWRLLRSKVRSQVRRPQKEDMSVRFGADQLDPFYAVFAHNMRDLGTPVLPLRFFRAILRAFPRIARVGVVYHRESPAAGGFGFLWRGELEMTWASALRDLSRLAPNMLLYWEFMKHAVEAGASRFNFGRCPPGGGTHRFKLQWGGVDEALPWLQWSASGRAGTPSPASGGFALATRLWQALPVRAATLLGPPIARTIP